METTAMRHATIDRDGPASVRLAKGDALDDPRFGERVAVLDVAADALRLAVTATPGPSRRPTSAHPRQSERFEVVAGTLGLTVAGREHLLGPGQSLVVPPGTRHRPRNAGTDELRFTAELRPTLRFPAFLAAITAANQSGKEGLPYLFLAAQALARFPDEERPTPLPRAVERALFAALGGLGRLLGHRLLAPRIARGAATDADG